MLTSRVRLPGGDARGDAAGMAKTQAARAMPRGCGTEANEKTPEEGGKAST